MIIDSSALIAILRQEKDASVFARYLNTEPGPRMSAATLLESSIVAGRSRQGDLDETIASAGIEVVPFNAEQLALARTAHATYGKGSGSAARLNFGDCFSYALAKVSGEPLLFKGDDFTHTDITSALPGP